MTKQTYKSAQGKTIDLGTIKLRNEHVRAVGNMNVNARGDVLDSDNKIIEPKSRQIQRQNACLTNVVDTSVPISSAAAKRARRDSTESTETPAPVPTPESVISAPEPVVSTPVTNDSNNTIATPDVEIPNVSNSTETTTPAAGGGLAAAIARSKIIKQEKEKTARQLAQENSGVRKI